MDDENVLPNLPNEDESGTEDVIDDINEDLYTMNDNDELINGKITPLMPKVTPKQEPEETPLGDV